MAGTLHTFEVVLECTQAGPPSTAVVKTTEVVGRIMEACDSRGLTWRAYYRREVLQALDCAKKGNKDALVRAALIELHGGTRQVAIGTKKNPGPFTGSPPMRGKPSGLLPRTSSHSEQHQEKPCPPPSSSPAACSETPR